VTPCFTFPLRSVRPITNPHNDLRRTKRHRSQTGPKPREARSNQGWPLTWRLKVRGLHFTPAWLVLASRGRHRPGGIDLWKTSAPSDSTFGGGGGVGGLAPSRPRPCPTSRPVLSKRSSVLHTFQQQDSLSFVTTPGLERRRSIVNGLRGAETGQKNERNCAGHETLRRNVS
jgi:hypothetical protein